jgi:hypothetical protein
LADNKGDPRPMTYELTRMGWPNSAAIVALALLPVLAMASGIGKPMSERELRSAQTATSCPMTGEALALLNADGPALPPARS